jgi:hypothetical protein
MRTFAIHCDYGARQDKTPKFVTDGPLGKGEKALQSCADWLPTGPQPLMGRPARRQSLPQDREGIRSHRPRNAAGHHRRGDAVTVPRHGHGGHEGYASPRTQRRFDCCAATSFRAACRSRVKTGLPVRRSYVPFRRVRHGPRESTDARKSLSVGRQRLLRQTGQHAISSAIPVHAGRRPRPLHELPSSALPGGLKAGRRQRSDPEPR